MLVTATVTIIRKDIYRCVLKYNTSIVEIITLSLPGLAHKLYLYIALFFCSMHSTGEENYEVSCWIFIAKRDYIFYFHFTFGLKIMIVYVKTKAATGEVKTTSGRNWRSSRSATPSTVRYFINSLPYLNIFYFLDLDFCSNVL